MSASTEKLHEELLALETQAVEAANALGEVPIELSERIEKVRVRLQEANKAISGKPLLNG